MADTDHAVAIVESLDFVDAVEPIDEGIMLAIAVQQIPEVVRALARGNIAVYAVQAERER